jgi:uncharacterized protein (TIGR03435 family)
MMLHRTPQTRHFLSAALCAVTVTLAVAQAPANSNASASHADGAAFEVADVHASPHSLHPFPRSNFHGGRYTMRQASMVDLIAAAYGVDADNVLGGPAWLETDRFDIYAEAPAGATEVAQRPMLQALLADRFHLVIHKDSKPLPAFILSAGKGGQKMTQAADPAASSTCTYVDPPPNPSPNAVPLYTFSCHNMTMEGFAERIRQWAGDYLTNPVVDSTGLTGGWDFDIHFHSRGRAARAGGDGVTIFDAVDKQLGLKLEAKTSPLPVIIVDSANEKPTPNPPGLDKKLPPPLPAEFEVATIRPTAPEVTNMNGRIQGSQVSLQYGTMQFMVTFAYDTSDDMVVNAPGWFTTDHFDINAKAIQDATPGAPQVDLDDLRMMMRKFLAERFNLKVHTEDRPLDAYTLMAGSSPKLKKADPANRTGCKEGPGADGKDPRITNPVLGRLLTCRNMTMAQFATELQNQASGYIHTPVLDATGIAGAYDFTLSFSTAGQLQSAPSNSNPNASTDAAGAGDPNGAISLADAIGKQMGLKLVKQKRPVPALVIDHVDEKPTDN